MIQRTEARQLSSRREWSLISSSLSPALQVQSAARLKSKISRARELRDKYRDLYRRQKLASKSRMTGTPYEKLNVRTFRKKQMFGEAITRLRHQLEKVSAPARAPARTPARVARRKIKTGPARAHVRRGRLASDRRKSSLKSRAASPELPKSMKLRAAGYTRRQTHVAASGRRRQAKRDSEGRR
jgi:hypothetical protein